MKFSEILLLNIAANFSVVCIYLYLYVQYRQLYFGLWLCGWSLLFFRIVFLSSSLPEIPPIILSLFQLTTIAGSLLLFIGTYVFFRMKLSPLWYLIALIATTITNIAIYMKLSFFWQSLPTAIYIGVLYIKTGILLVRCLEIKSFGKYLTGIGFIMLGLHAFDLPFLVSIAWFAPWGYLIDAVLRFVIALGTLFIYFEKTRLELLTKDCNYKLLAENSTDVIFKYIFHPTQRFQYISPSVVRLTGYSPPDFYMSKRFILSIIYPLDRPIINMFLRNFFSEEEYVLTLRLRKKDKSIIWIELKTTPIFSTNSICGFEGIVRDITTRKNLEQDVSRLDRLHTVGQMAASVAHEIRNPMTTVRGYLQYFLSKKEFYSYAKQFQLMIEELDRTNTIIKEYLALSQHRTVDLQILQLNSIVESLYPLMKAEANATNKDIELKLGNIPDLYLEGKEIRQLILNLVRNGLEAMNPGGKIIIHSFKDQEEVILAIQDEGSGIPQNIIENLGKPFLTTKENGTGLGLAVCQRIVSRHQATLKVSSHSSGTTFYIRFKTISL